MVVFSTWLGGAAISAPPAAPLDAPKRPSVTLVESGKTSWRIRVVSRECEPALFAARECSRYLHKITGAEVPVTTERGANRSIVLGLRKDMPGELAKLLPPPAEGHDGFSLSIVGKGEPSSNEDSSEIVLIVGENPRGVVYGVYGFLERAGCRWFYPTLDADDPEVVPRTKTLKLPPVRLSVASPFRIRFFCWISFVEKKDTDRWRRITDWAVKCRYNTIGWDALHETGNVDQAVKRGLILETGGHGFGKFLKTEDYFKDHPQWFGMQDGKRVPHAFLGSQFCWSNEAAQKVFAENVEKFVRGHPEIGLLALYGLDGVPACQCPECKKLHPSDHELQVMNRVARRLENAAPRVFVRTGGGYPPVQTPPVETKPYRNLGIIWSHWGRSHETGYDSEHYGYKKNLEQWLELSEGRFTAFQYYSDHFAEPWVAAPYAIAIRGDRKYLVENRAEGTASLLYPQGYWWNSGFNQYMAGRCFYDGSADSLDIIRDYAIRYYGPDAGAYLAKYLEEWATHPRLAYRTRGGATNDDLETLKRQRTEWLTPAIQSVSGDSRYAYRVKKIERLHTLAERLMDAHLRAHEVETLIAQGDRGAAAGKMTAARRNLDDLASQIRSLVDLDQGLVDEQLLSFFLPGLRKALEQQEKRLAGESGVADGGEKENAAEKNEGDRNPVDMVPEEARK